MKKDLFERIALWTEKYFKLALCFFAVLVLIIPLLVWFFYNVIPIKVQTDISADGMLSYCGSVIAGLLTLFLTCIAFYQGKKNSEMEFEYMYESRKVQIKPSLLIKIIPQPDNVFEIIVENNGESAAINIYIGGMPLFPCIKGHDKRLGKFSIGKSETGTISLDERNFSFSENGYPKEIDLEFADIDNNYIVQVFYLIEDNCYQTKELYYTS